MDFLSRTVSRRVILKEFADSFDRPGMEAERPYKCDFLKLRDKALTAFGGEPSNAVH